MRPRTPAPLPLRVRLSPTLPTRVIPSTYRATCTQDLELGKEGLQKARRVFESNYVMKPEALEAGVKAYIILDGLSLSETQGDDRVYVDTNGLKGKCLVLAAEATGGTALAAEPAPGPGSRVPVRRHHRPGLPVQLHLPPAPRGPRPGGGHLAGDDHRDPPGGVLHRERHLHRDPPAGGYGGDRPPEVHEGGIHLHRAPPREQGLGGRHAVTTRAPWKGTATWYFEPRQGVLIRYRGTESSEGREVAAGAANRVHQETRIEVDRVPEA